MLESRRFRRFLSVLGPPGYQKQLSHVPLVLGTIILVPFRPQEARLVPIMWFFGHFFNNFWVKKEPRNHPKQSPTSRPKNQGPPQDSSQPFQSLKTNVSFILGLPKSSKTRKHSFSATKHTLVDRGAPYRFCYNLTEASNEIANGGPWCTLPSESV